MGNRRAVVVGGARTPFVRAFGKLLKVDTIGLGVSAVGSLLDAMDLDRSELDGIVWGGVILPGLAPNVGREIALDLKLPYSVEAFTVTRACASGLQAITSAVSAIERGDADVMIAGGSDSTSNAEIKLPQKVVHAMAPVAFGKATPGDLLGVMSQLVPISEILPKAPKIAERTTGQVMGEAAEEMARRNEISREAQDALAVQSHHRAAAAIRSGRFDREVYPVELPGGDRVAIPGTLLITCVSIVEDVTRLVSMDLKRAGDPLLKSVLIEAAHRLRRYEPRWRQLSDSMAARGKPASVIVAAVANRWVRGLHHQMKEPAMAA